MNKAANHRLTTALRQIMLHTHNPTRIHCVARQERSAVVPIDADEIGANSTSYGHPMTETTQPDWNALLEAVGLNQDRRAYRQLFDHFAPLVKAYAINKQYNAAGTRFADELVQDVMLRIWQKASSFNRRKASASTWIFTVARNRRIDLLRRDKQITVSLETEDIWPEQDDHADEDIFTTTQHTNRRREIGAALAKLPSEQAQIIHAVFMQGKSHSEVASDMNLALGTVKSRARLGMEKLKVMLSRQLL